MTKDLVNKDAGEMAVFGETTIADFEEATGERVVKPRISVISTGSTYLPEEAAFENRGKFYVHHTKEILDCFDAVVLLRYENYKAYNKESEESYFTNDLFKSSGKDLPIYTFLRTKEEDKSVTNIASKGDRDATRSFLKTIEPKKGIYGNHLIVELDGVPCDLYLGGGSTENLFSFMKTSSPYCGVITRFSTSEKKGEGFTFYPAVLTATKILTPDIIEEKKAAALGIHNEIKRYWIDLIQKIEGGGSVDEPPIHEENPGVSLSQPTGE